MNALPKEAIIEYQEIYKKVYGREISFGKALEFATRLLNLLALIEKPVYVNENEKLYPDPK